MHIFFLSFSHFVYSLFPRDIQTLVDPLSPPPPHSLLSSSSPELKGPCTPQECCEATARAVLCSLVIFPYLAQHSWFCFLTLSRQAVWGEEAPGGILGIWFDYPAPAVERIGFRLIEEMLGLLSYIDLEVTSEFVWLGGLQGDNYINPSLS